MKQITYATREGWLADRPNRIGASESPGILGQGYAGESAFNTYVRKVSPTLDEVIDATLAERFDIGTRQEPLIGALFSERTGLFVYTDEEPTVRVSDDRAYVAATLDGYVLTDEGAGTWEAKNVGEYDVRSDRHDWEDGPLPMRVQIQKQHQMFVTGWQFGYVAALLGGNRVVWHRVERNQRFIDNLVLVLDDFWGHVQRREPPPVDGTEATAAALKRLYGKDNGETVMLPAMITLPGDKEPVELDATRQELKASIKDRKAKLQFIDNTIKAAIGSATYGQVPGDKARYRWMTGEQHRKATEEKTISVKTFLRLKNEYRP